jgi:3-hydroxybutyryl-CoA dehydrogenase
MGAGIAEVLARSGHHVVAIEANHTALARGLAALHASLDKAVARGRLAAVGKGEIVARVRAAGRPADAVGIHLAEPEAGRSALAELIVTHLTATGAVATAAALAARLGLGAVTARDRPGFLTAALTCPHLNDAARMVQDGYATAADIDAAMMLGCGYPRGPLEMLHDTGPAAVMGVLSAMYASSADPAFAPVPLLAEHGAAGTRFRG